MQTDIDNTNVKLLIVGDGPQSKELKKSQMNMVFQTELFLLE